jgi:hypothetical protein
MYAMVSDLEFVSSGFHCGSRVEEVDGENLGGWSVMGVVD